VLVDAALAGGLGEVTLTAPVEVEVGARAHLIIRAGLSPRAGHVEAAVALDPRLAPGGVVAMPLARKGEVHEGDATITPDRRGPGRIDAVWLRWQGPLGLGARQAKRDLDRPLRVNPNLALLRSRGVQATLRDADIGLVARRMHGDGTMFEALSDYHPGMDRRRIDWKASARHAHLYAKEYEAERNNRIVFAVDCGQAMCEPVAGLARLDRAISVALAAGWVALKGAIWSRCSALPAGCCFPRPLSPMPAGLGGCNRRRRCSIMNRGNRISRWLWRPWRSSCSAAR
jgi:uncharacterized protein (DUF58 family)